MQLNPIMREGYFSKTTEWSRKGRERYDWIDKTGHKRFGVGVMDQDGRFSMVQWNLTRMDANSIFEKVSIGCAREEKWCRTAIREWEDGKYGCGMVSSYRSLR